MPNTPKQKPEREPRHVPTPAERAAEAKHRANLRAQFWAGPLEAEFDRPTIGALMDVGSKTMELYASRGDSPPYVLRGKRSWYKKADVLVWLEKRAGQKVTSTAERGFTKREKEVA
jgi:hypothetical protein